ncbi:hypothetical protein H5410_000726 [Solanum commersonii]|uniref:Uncharacterized protein n=1 Tax=Solanum commersonii TaxID=4109 RepID=A0A9J6AXB3_SOLCO|nr:hypothetical protein H5410_000726 [Solanum commersonii]
MVMGEALMGMGAWVVAGILGDMWNKATRQGRVSRGKFGGHKGDWWWNGEVQAQSKRERKRSDLDQVKCIKDEEGKISWWKRPPLGILDLVGALGQGGYHGLLVGWRGRSGRSDEIPVEFWKSMDKGGHRVVKRGI